MKCLVSKNSVYKSVVLTLVSVLCFAGVSVGQTYELVPLNNVSRITYLPSCSVGGEEFYEVVGTTWGQAFYLKKNGVKVSEQWSVQGSDFQVQSSYWTGSENVVAYVLNNHDKGSYYFSLNPTTKKVSFLSTIPDCAIDWTQSITAWATQSCNLGSMQNCGADKVWFKLTATNTDNIGFRVKLGDVELGAEMLSSSLTFNNGWIGWIPGYLNNGTELYIVIDKKNKTLVSQSSEPTGCGSRILTASILKDETCLSKNPVLSSSYTEQQVTPPVYYQWYEGYNAISGATNSTYSPTAVGEYKVRVYVTPGDESTSAISDAVPITGPTITTAVLSADNTIFCVGASPTLSVTDDASCSPSGYPKYEWYKDEELVETTTSSTYPASGSGSWNVKIYASAGVYKESSPVVIEPENPTLSLNKSSLSFENLLDNPIASAQQIIPSVEGTCKTYIYSYTTSNSNFSVDADGNVVFNNNTGTSGIYNGTIGVTATPVGGGNPLTTTVSVSGTLRDCVPAAVVSGGNMEGGLPSWIQPSSSNNFSSSTDQNITNNYSDFYRVSSSKVGTNIGNFQSADGNVLHTFSKSADCTVLTIKNSDNVDQGKMYVISFSVGNNSADWQDLDGDQNKPETDRGAAKAKYGVYDKNGMAVSVGSTELGFLQQNTKGNYSVVVSGADLIAGIPVKLHITGRNGGKTSAYFDNIQIESTCPPKIEITDASDICSSSPSITASVIKGSADIAKYEWYIKGVADSDFSLLETNASTSLTDLYNSSSEIPSGSIIKAVVYDKNGSKAEILYEVSCGPIIDPINEIETICVSGNITDLEVPHYTSSSTVSAQGWEVASSPDAVGSEWVSLTSLENIPLDYKNYYIRYYAVNEQGKGKSNAVQITMFEAPIVNPISVSNICVGGSFVLNNPTVVFSKTGDEQEGWQYKYSEDSDYETLESSTIFNTEGTIDIRYLAYDGCQTAYSYTTAEVHESSIEITEYRTYMRVAGTQQVVADAPVLDATCVGELSYSITDGNTNGYFSINETTGVITMTSAATETGKFPITVTITDGTTTITKDLIITITEEPTLMLQCSGETDYYAYTKYQKLNIQNVVTSNFVNDNVMLELTGSAASYFELSSSEVTKNTANVLVTIAQSDFFTSVGDYTLKLTATTEGLTQECNVNIHTKSLSINEYINDQTNCSSDAPLLMVEVTGEDATNLPLTYQWYNNGIAVSGATSKTFKPTVDGDYYCEVSTGGTLLHKSKSANVFFVKNMPVLSFDETAAPIPSEVFCTQEVGAVMKVTLNGADVTSDYKRYWWLIGSESDGLTSDNIHTFSFDCASNDYTATIGAYIMENTTKCVIKMAKAVTIKKMANTYYYYGPTGDDSDVTDRKNWYSCKDKSTGELIIPNVNYIVGKVLKENVDLTLNNQYGNYERTLTCSCPEVDPATNVFMGDGCKYIINKDDVKLKADQTWTVSGEGAKIVVGNGYWENGSLPGAGNGWETKTNTYGYKNGQYAEGMSSGMNGTNQVDKFTTVANTDYRNYAKEFTIEGTLDVYNNITLDVSNGGSLKIATSKGNFKLGELATDKITNQEGSANGFYNVMLSPSSSVTYTGDGAKNIRSGQYGQLYIDADEVVFEENADIKIVQVFKYDNETDFDNIDPNGSTISYIGSVNQEVASMPYHNLVLQGATEKTLSGNIDVESSFLIGQGVTCKAGDNTININGSGSDALVFEGKKFDCGTSTVNYKSTDETTVAAMSYYNLNLGTGNRTLQAKNIIGIAGTFQADDDATYVVDGSTVEFNGDGSVTQTIPAFKFNNLTINSSALEHNTSNSFNDAYNVTLQGDVDVANRLILTKGVLKTNGNVLEVSNTDADAVGQGYYTSTQDAAFIYGDLTRQFPANASSDGQMYYFPIGDKDGYKPFITSQITTIDVSEVTVGLSGGMSGTFSEADGGGNVSTLYSWHLTADDNYVDGRVAVSTSQGLNNANAVAYGTSTSGSNFENIYGSTSGNTIMYTQKKGAGYYSLVTRTIQSHKYYFNCSGTTDISDINAWYTQENGGGTIATSFDEPDAEWIIKCGTTISSPLAIMGANSKVTINIPKGESLKINSSAEFITATHEEGTIEIGKTGEMKIDYGFSMSDASISNRTTINNKGRLDLRNADIRLTNSNIINDGMLYSENVNWEMTSPANQGYKTAANDKHTKFINNGTVQMVNANFDVPRGGGGDGNIVHIRNAAGAVWLIDNTNASGAKHVDFNGCNFEHEDVGYGEIYVDFQCGSSFVVKKSDMKMVYGSAGMVQRIGGEIVVEDGNLFITRYSQTGGNFTLEQSCGAMYLTDTDKSGDGILQLQGGGGGYEVNIAGTMYVMGMVEQGGSGASFNVLDGGTVFIGNIGALMPAYSWQFTINIEDKGTLYYCGNRSAGPDNVGTNNGELFYAGSYYYDSDPVSEKDFKNTGEYNLMFVGEEDCMEQYWEGIPATDKTTLLPIELTMLYAVCNEQGEVELHWQTASETNNEYFTILRSFDGVHFEELDIVWGAGTTTEFHNYEYFDTDDNTGIVYYKLRQTDYDGNTTESKVIAVQTCGPNAQFRIAEDQIDIFFNHPEESSFVVITSITGQIFYSKSFRNTEAARIAAPQRKGIYIISVIDSKTITSEKFIR